MTTGSDLKSTPMPAPIFKNNTYYPTHTHTNTNLKLIFKNQVLNKTGFNSVIWVQVILPSLLASQLVTILKH